MVKKAKMEIRRPAEATQGVSGGRAWLFWLAGGVRVLSPRNDNNKAACWDELRIFGAGIATRECDPKGLGRSSIWQVWRYDRGGIVKEGDDSFKRVAGTGTMRWRRRR